MEHGDENSNPLKKHIIRSQNSGVVIQEASKHANIPNGAPNNDENPQHHYLPLANLTRIMRSILPSHARIADDAKETIQECTSKFIHLITAEANEKCQKEHRKTITSEDLISAMGALGFTDYIEPLTLFLNKHRMQDAGSLAGRPLRFVQPYVGGSNVQSSPSLQVVQVPNHVVQNSAMHGAQGYYVDHTQIGDQQGRDEQDDSRRGRGRGKEEGEGVSTGGRMGDS